MMKSVMNREANDKEKEEEEEEKEEDVISDERQKIIYKMQKKKKKRRRRRRRRKKKGKLENIMWKEAECRRDGKSDELKVMRLISYRDNCKEGSINQLT